jgi:hypothetical protein
VVRADGNRHAHLEAAPAHVLERSPADPYPPVV